MSDKLLELGIVSHIDHDVEIIIPKYDDHYDSKHEVRVNIDYYMATAHLLVKMQHAMYRLMENMSLEDKLAFLSDERISYNIIENTIEMDPDIDSKRVGKKATYIKSKEEIIDKENAYV